MRWKRYIITVLRCGSIALLVAFSFFCAGIIFLASDDRSVQHTIERNHQLASEFNETARFVEAFRKQHARLPDGDELNTGRTYHFIILEVSPGQFLEEDLAALGRPHRPGYVLGIWRGEWWEYYASWSGETTLTFDASAYYLSGGRVEDVLIGVFGMFFCLMGSIGIWRRGKPSRWNSRPSAFHRKEPPSLRK